ncbi:hypothetical protein [Capnocytophaga catalasegens]|uniref:Uncharacterized protein n=1 Tax=Capnocytophaga catalasegens TaxID=1004260 RepID=A0AAV5AWF8_9FLAO|nr:hypothetical protein [Capnocytophaga catalasegens]GIZ16213.1 hypothetical protein RCZ03_22130 [Capnocytophaga catalasegens]GJM51642.1 hypothetical protein RCZ15_26150 [Capnocytophaga catalasegens]GJM54332.1 hypothetical protein RCZ16_26480 [Capnocytophaga catalasegens]
METKLGIYQLGYASLGAGKTQGVVPIHKSPQMKDLLSSERGSISGNIINRKPQASLTPKQQRQANRLARQELRKKRPSYFERNGERRLDTLLNGLSNIVGAASSVNDLINNIKRTGSYYIDQTGTKQPLTNEDKEVLVDYVQSQQAQGIDFQTMMLLLKSQEKPTNNTALYIGIGGAVFVLLLMVMMNQNKNNK